MTLRRSPSKDEIDRAAPARSSDHRAKCEIDADVIRAGHDLGDPARARRPTISTSMPCAGGILVCTLSVLGWIRCGRAHAVRDAACAKSCVSRRRHVELSRTLVTPAPMRMRTIRLEPVTGRYDTVGLGATWAPGYGEYRQRQLAAAAAASPQGA